MRSFSIGALADRREITFDPSAHPDQRRKPLPAEPRIEARILHIGKYYAPHYGGIERVVEDVVDYMKGISRGADVVCFSTPESGVTDESHRGIFRFRPDATVRSAPISFRMLRWLYARRAHYDLVHVHLPNPWALLIVPFLGPGTKVVLHWHAVIERQRLLKHLVAPFSRLALRRSAAVITTSPVYAAAASELQPFRHKVSVVPIGIDDPSVEFVRGEAARRVDEAVGGRKLVFALGRHVHYKGFECLVDAAEYLPDDVCVVIGGSGPLSRQLRERIDRRHLQHKVLLPGTLSKEESHAYMRASGVFVLPSISRLEAFGIVQVEAMAFGKCVISTDIPGSGVPWVNQHMSTGIVVRPGDPAALAKGILRVLQVPGLAERLGRGGRRRYESQFTKDRMLHEMARVYLKVLGQPTDAVVPTRMVPGMRLYQPLPRMGEPVLVCANDQKA